MTDTTTEPQIGPYAAAEQALFDSDLWFSFTSQEGPRGWVADARKKAARLAVDAALEVERQRIREALAPLVRAALKVVGDERGMSENEADYEALTDASARVPWAVYDELGIDAGASL